MRARRPGPAPIPRSAFAGFRFPPEVMSSRCAGSCVSACRSRSGSARRRGRSVVAVRRLGSGERPCHRAADLRRPSETQGLGGWYVQAALASHGRGLHHLCPSCGHMFASVGGQQRGSSSNRSRPHEAPPVTTMASGLWPAIQGSVEAGLPGFLDGMQGVRAMIGLPGPAGRSCS
jgi:hypothetical protein